VLCVDGMWNDLFMKSVWRDA